MKRNRTRFLSFIMSVICIATMLFPQEAMAAPTAFDTMLARLDKLEKLAVSYHNSNSSTSVDQLMFSYIRSARYTGTTWNLTAGTPDENFISYVQQQSPDTANLRTMGSIALPNGEVTDTVHMFAVMNMVQRGAGDLGGWIGDTCQMLQDIQNESGTTEELVVQARKHFLVDGYFGHLDWIADIDGYNLTQEKQSGETWAECLSRYFTVGLTERRRVASFIQNNWGDSYTEETTTKNQYRNLVKSRYSSAGIIALQISIFGISGVPAQKYRDAVCYAVADYCYEAVSAPVPQADSITVIYPEGTLQLAEGIIANSNSSFSGEEYKSGSIITPGMTLYLKGARNVESGIFFPSETVKNDLPLLADAPPPPQFSFATADSIGFVSLEGFQFSSDGGMTWQDSSVFSGLAADTEYHVICRYKVAGTTSYSASSDECIAKTAPATEINGDGKNMFFTVGDRISHLFMAVYSKEGKLIGLSSGTEEDGIIMFTAPSETSCGSAHVFALSENGTPMATASILPNTVLRVS